MTWTKSETKTLPATGNRNVQLTTEGGVQIVPSLTLDIPLIPV
mgnify:CR=1 FL=1